MHVISICGGSGSGNTTFADKICINVDQDVTVLHMDPYCLHEHLQNLRNGMAIKSLHYDFKKNKRLNTYSLVKAAKVNQLLHANPAMKITLKQNKGKK